METVLITGGGGYIGSVLTRKLLGRGFEVVVVDSLVFSDVGLRDLYGQESLNVVRADIRDLASYGKILKGIDCVVHLAAIANDPSAELDPQLTREVNLKSYTGLLDGVLRAHVKRFINVSSISVYGLNRDDNLDEESSLNPLTEYGRCKAESEKIVHRYHNEHQNKLTTVTLRPGTVCGWSPRMRFDLCANMLTGCALSTGKLSVWGGRQQRPHIHISDLTDMIIELVNAPRAKIAGRVFNAAGQNATVSEIAETIKEEMAERIEVTSGTPRADERSYSVSSERIRTELGFTMKRNIRDAIADIIQAHQNGLWRNPDEPIYHNVRMMKSMECAVI